MSYKNNSKVYHEADIRNDYRKLTKLLIEKNLTITTMESASSGQIASLITDTEGSSAVLKGAFVTYCNEAKIMQGVPAEVLDKYTVYSKETAEAMVRACTEAYTADIGIGVTGTMGNIDPANPDASVPGQVYFAIGVKGEIQSYYVELDPQPSCLAYKLAVAKEINTAELQKQSRQLTSEKMKLYDDYKDGRIDRDSYKQRAEKISVQLDEIKRKIEDAENSKKLLEQNELSDKIKLKDFLGIQKFDTEKLREVIKVIRVHSQDEIEIEWNFDDIFSEQR